MRLKPLYKQPVSAILLGWALLVAPAGAAYAQFGAFAASAPTISRIEISGNQRIETSTIQSYLGVAEGDEADKYDINKALKKLFETGFFADANIVVDGSTLRVEVVENPLVSQVAFEGNEKISDDDLKKEVNLRGRSIYTRTKLQQDVTRLLEIYRRNGRYSAQIEPKVIQLEQNRINLVYEIDEGPVTRVAKIIFIGNDAFTTSDLMSVVSTEEELWYRFLSDNDIYDQERVQYDKELLRRFYTSEGYADFKVKSTVAELTPSKDAFYITYVLDEGPRYTFGNVKVRSKLKGAKAPTFDEELTTKQGDFYNANEVETTVDNMVEKLGNLGFAFVEIDPKLRRHEDKDVIDVTFDIEEGPRVYVERINIFGNLRTLDEVIRREFRVAEGDPYSTSKLRRSEQRLNNLGFFEKVSVTTEQGSTPDRTVINVEVEEKSTGEITLGAGFSTADGPLTDIGLREKNLLGKGQDLRFRVQLSGERQQYDVGFTEPYFLDRELAAGFDLFRTTYDFRSESSFDRDQTGLRLRAGYALSEKLRHSVKYSIDSTEITDIRADASRFVRDQEGKNTTSMVGHSLTYDDRDNKFAPTDGWLWEISQDIAGLGGDSNFLRHEVRSSYYIPLAPKWVLSFSGQGGHVFTIDGDPLRINHRFFIGSRQIRGFDDAGLGPRDIVTDDALGGNIFYTGSAEMSFPLGLPDDLGFLGATFIDVGSLYDVDDSGPEVVDDTSLRLSAGVGVSWASPFGPIRLDLAKALLKEDYDIEETLRFSFGTRF